MKTKLNISLLMLLGVMVYFFSANSMPEKNIRKSAGSGQHISSNGGGKFIIGAFDTGKDVNLSHMNELGFNLWHRYTQYAYNPSVGRDAPYLSATDNLMADINDYKGDVHADLDKAEGKNMSGLLMRPKIEWLCLGQRSDYQCEPIAKSDTTQWFYSFRDHNVGTPVADSGGTVIYCQVNPNQTGGGAGWVVKGLKANKEQCNPDKYNFRADRSGKWYIKPRIRIDPAIVKSTQNPKVCRIKVLWEDGITLLKDVDIFAKDFLVDLNGMGYDGRYLEEYNFTGGRNLEIDSNWGRHSWFSARGEFPDSILGNNKTDIQVEWYGQCDMWIDYIRVDNDIANDLFKGVHNDWLQCEAEQIAAYNNTTYRFYLELFEYNNVPCMSYVSKKLDSLVYAASLGTKHTSLMCITIPTTYTMHVPRSDRFTVQNLKHFKKFFMDKMGAYDFLLAAYPFNTPYLDPEIYTTENSWTRIPNTLPNLNGENGKGVLAPPVAPSAYDTWLQEYFDHSPYSFEPGAALEDPLNGENEPGYFRYIMQRGDALSKMTGKPFIFNAQAHMWKTKLPTSERHGIRLIPGEVQREPTNEEMDLTANLAIAYGAKGIIYFEYKTDKNTAIGDVEYDRGMVDINNQPRYKNIYGQEKWENMKSLVQRIKKWEPYIMSFDNVNRRSYIYRLERNLMGQETYIKDIITANTQNLTDDESKRYIQTSVFKNDSLNKSYFMIVNRRCSPVKTGFVDGRRNIKIVFNMNSDIFANFTVWRIVDLGKNEIVVSFDKRTVGNIDLGMLHPGEGKLYKLEPVN